jgi:hypothetical protein
VLILVTPTARAAISAANRGHQAVGTLGQLYHQLEEARPAGPRMIEPSTESLMMNGRVSPLMTGHSTSGATSSMIDLMTGVMITRVIDRTIGRSIGPTIGPMIGRMTILPTALTSGPMSGPTIARMTGHLVQSQCSKIGSSIDFSTAHRAAADPFLR